MPGCDKGCSLDFKRGLSRAYGHGSPFDYLQIGYRCNLDRDRSIREAKEAESRTIVMPHAHSDLTFGLLSRTLSGPPCVTRRCKLRIAMQVHKQRGRQRLEFPTRKRTLQEESPQCTLSIWAVLGVADGRSDLAEQHR